MAFGFNPAQFQQATALDPMAAGGLPAPQNLPAVIPQQAQAQPEPQAAPQGSADSLPAPPQWGHRGVVGDLLDNLFLGGAIQHTRADEYARQVQDYQNQLGRREAVMGYQLAQQSPDPTERAWGQADPIGYLKTLQERAKPVATKGGETLGGLTGPKFSAPVYGVSPDGVGYNSTPDKTVSTGAIPVFKSVPFTDRADFVRPGEPHVPLMGMGATGAPQARPGQAVPAALPAPGGASPAASGPLDPTAFFKSFILKHEGGLNPSDMNGSPTNMGFNQAANPQIDVTKLTPESAAQRFAMNYYGPSGAAKLPAPMAAVYADTYFMNPAKARQFLAQSGGDPGKFMDAREAWQGGMVQNNPAAAPYANAWAKRNADLRSFASSLGQPQAAQGGAPASAPDQGAMFPARPMTPPALNPSTETYQQTGPTGKVEDAGKPAFGFDQKRGLMQDVVGDARYKEYAEAANAVNGLHDAMAQMAGNNGVISNAATDLYTRTLTGGVARPQAYKLFLEHLGLPQALESKLNEIVGNGSLTPTTLRQMDSVMTSYAKAKQRAAQQAINERESLAKGYGGSLGLAVPDLQPTPKVKWLEESNGPPSHPIGPEEAAALSPGTRFIGLDGKPRIRK
jgi:hypothetical protein